MILAGPLQAWHREVLHGRLIEMVTLYWPMTSVLAGKRMAHFVAIVATGTSCISRALQGTWANDLLNPISHILQVATSANTVSQTWRERASAQGARASSICTPRFSSSSAVATTTSIHTGAEIVVSDRQKHCQKRAGEK